MFASFFACVIISLDCEKEKNYKDLSAWEHFERLQRILILSASNNDDQGKDYIEPSQGKYITRHKWLLIFPIVLVFSSLYVMGWHLAVHMPAEGEFFTELVEVKNGKTYLWNLQVNVFSDNYRVIGYVSPKDGQLILVESLFRESFGETVEFYETSQDYDNKAIYSVKLKSTQVIVPIVPITERIKEYLFELILCVFALIFAIIVEIRAIIILKRNIKEEEQRKLS